MSLTFPAKMRLSLPAACLFLCAGIVRADTFVVTNTADSGAGSLRWAIQSSNGTAGPNTVNFNIVGGVPVSIAPLSALPTVTTPVTIDGTSQPGFSGTPVVELNGASTGASVAGIHIQGGNCTLKGLAINRFSDCGIRIEQTGGNIIEGNYIGTDVTGLLGLGNSTDGIRMENGSAEQS